jgi:DNA-binding MarR family transcriptional regulator
LLTTLPTPLPATLPAKRHAIDVVDASYLQTLLGYNARRVSLQSIELFTQRMERFSITPVDFSILSLVQHNPGITSRQLCAALSLLPPNLVGKIGMMQKRDWLARKPHPDDGRAVGLYLTDAGGAMVAEAERVVTELENEVSSKLTSTESKTLLRLLQKIYL